MNRGAAAIFVKTPGLSPIKTRLRCDVGSEATEAFYKFSVDATQDVSAEAARHALSVSINLTPYWAVAEPEGVSHPMWSKFENIFQGRGGLGRRLSNIYSELLCKYDFVILIGADCPQMPWNYLIDAATFLRESVNRFVIGPASDGGFYLFGGNAPLAEDLWTGVVYSNTNTAAELMKEVRKFGDVSQLAALTDIDTVNDLRLLADIGSHGKDLLPSQLRVIEWSRTISQNT